MGIGAILKCQKSNLWAIPVNQYNPPVLSQLGDSFSRKIDIFTLDFCFEWFASFKQGITAESDNQCWFVFHDLFLRYRHDAKGNSCNVRRHVRGLIHHRGWVKR